MLHKKILMLGLTLISATNTWSMSGQQLQQLKAAFNNALRSEQFDQAQLMINQLEPDKRQMYEAALKEEQDKVVARRQKMEQNAKEMEQQRAQLLEESKKRRQKILEEQSKREEQARKDIEQRIEIERKLKEAAAKEHAAGGDASNQLLKVIQERDAQLAALQAERDKHLAERDALKIKLDATAGGEQANQKRIQELEKLLKESNTLAVNKENALRKQIEAMKKESGTAAERAQQSKIIRQRMNKLYDDNNELSQQLEKARKDLENAQKEIKDFDISYKVQQEQIQAKEKECQARIEKTRQAMDIANEEAQKLSEENEQLEANVKKLTAERDTALAASKKAGSECVAEKAQVKQLNAELEEANARIKTLRELAQETQKEKDDQKRLAVEEVKKCINRENAVRKEKDQIEAAVQELNKQLKEARAAIDETLKTNKAFGDRLATYQNTITRIINEIKLNEGANKEEVTAELVRVQNELIKLSSSLFSSVLE